VLVYSNLDLFFKGLSKALNEQFGYVNFFIASRQSLSKLKSYSWDLAILHFVSYADFLQSFNELECSGCPTVILLRRLNEELLRKLSLRPNTVVLKENIDFDGLILVVDHVLKKGRASENEIRRSFPHLSDRLVSTRVLTIREKEIVYLLAKGLTAYSIGMALGISVNTVRNHINRIYAKLGVNDRVSAIIKALSLGLISDLVDPKNDEKEDLSEP
jgi:DNA-binding NarL/FixJ family response regulator